jgi:CRISPR/Cas system-associated exonuclease Cas4 (RecB family)
MNRILVCGGRDFRDKDFLFKTLDKLKMKLGGDIIIIEGGAKGADILAKDWAIKNETPFEEYLADWKTHGKSAGPKRNQVMLNSNPNMVIAFSGGVGTKNMAKIAKNKGVAVWEPKRFTHIDLGELPHIKRVDTSKGRFYLLPNGDTVPSVTTVTSLITRDAIEEWKARVGPAEAEKVSNESSDIGERFHKICENYINNVPYYYGNGKNEFQFQYLFPHVIDEINKIDKIYGVELTLFSDKLKLAGTTDVAAEYEGVASIIDFKTSKRPKEEEWMLNYFVQMTAYSLMLEERTGKKFKQIVLIMLELSGNSVVYVRNRDDYVNELVKTIKQYRRENKG